MRTKGVLFLGLIICWTAVCNGEDGFLYDYGIGDVPSKELAEDYLFRAYAPVPCTADSECSEKQKCVEEEGKKTCQCADGLGGENCEIKEWCEKTGKFENCKGENGKCEYSKEKRSVVCTCATGKKLHPEGNICKAVPCTDESQCSERDKCVGKEGEKICQCADGLSGNDCEKNDWCEDPGKFKYCKGENGKCEYSKEKRSVVCTCTTGKKLHPQENICKDGCSTDEDCPETQRCVEKYGWKTCKCADGLSGNDCEKNDWCKETGKFKDCKSENGTCEYSKEKRSVVCTCATGKKLHPKENICKDACSKDEDCTENQRCVQKDGFETCKCADGRSGKDCEKNAWCEHPGKFKYCKGENGTCEYNKEKRRVVCTCAIGKKFHPIENICKDACSTNTDCTETQRCVLKVGWQTCKCADGLSGNDCEKNDWCQDPGKFKDCKGENGTCEYSKEKRSVLCTCASGKKVHPKENICKETCNEDTECKYEGKCERKVGGNKFCSCNLGLTGDKCQTVFDCSPSGKYKGCENSGGKCKFDGSKAVCECSGNKKLDVKENVCKECDCGPKGTCKFENGVKNCACEEGFAVKNGRCTECDCGPGGTCKFENGVKNCTCEEGFAVRNGRCTETCNEGDCKYGSECKAFGELHFCVCAKGLSGDKCNIVNECGDKGKFKKCIFERGSCDYDTDKKEAVCTCYDGKELNSALNYCQETCTTGDDCNGGQCAGPEGKRFCKCKPQLEGDKCQIVKDCDSGKYSECEKSGGNCEFDGTKTACKCPEGKKLDESLTKHICRQKCKTNDYCQNGGTCNSQTNLCKCKPNTSGDKCETISGCEPLKCKDINAECVYDQKVEMPTCKCENNYYYEKGECKPEYCRNGCNLAVSKCEYKDGVGICKCQLTGYYYNYAARSCKKIDPCFNKTCDGDLICRNGKCQCPDNNKHNGTRCEQMDLCKDNSLCFPDAKCEAGNSFGYVKCTCNSASAFYLPKTGRCNDGSCFLSDHRKDCKKPCPQGMSFKDGDCKHDVDTRKCDKDCGFLGWCYNVSKTEQNCVCLSSYAAIDQKTKKCVLKSSVVCPTKERDGDRKCKCTGKYKQATNGITCELKSCSDEDVVKECKSKGAIKCVDNWKKGGGYECVCPDGYVTDSEKRCIDPCSQDQAKNKCSSNGQVCYIGDRDRDGDCRCPPTFTYNETKKSCDRSGDNTFMIQGLPVFSKKYETSENNINKVVLNRDVAASMKQAFANLDFVHVFSFKVDKEVLLCDVWLQFKSNLPPTFNATLEVRRWKSLAVEGKNEFLLPPQLLLSSSHTSATSEELTLCIDSVRHSVCGSGSICENNKCKCRDGFREIDSTIKAYSDKRIVRCEDIDECTEAKHDCKENSTCLNTLGDYFCVCNSGFKKAKGDADAWNKEACIGLCDPNPCSKGSCKLTKENNLDCTCTPGYSGSYCNRADVNLAKAGKSTKVVGAVLGTLLAIVIILIIVYIVRQRKNSYSEDFTPAPRVDNAEMIERRPMRGVTNRAYQ